MRIAYLHQYFTTPDEPGGTRSFEFAVRIARRGHQVDVITTDYRSTGRRGKGRWSVAEVEDVSVHRLELPYRNEMSYRTRIFVFLAFAFGATRQLFRLKPDLIFATSTPLTIAIPALVYRTVHRVPLVFEVRDAWPEIPIALGVLKGRVTTTAALLLELLAYVNSYAVVALSPGMKDSVARTGYPGDRISVIPNACDFSDPEQSEAAGRRWLAANPWARDRKLVVYLGAFGITHDATWIVELAPHVRAIDPRVCFAVFGEGAENDAMVERARELGVLGETVHILPEIPKSEVPGVLESASVGLSTMMPIPELEANSANKFFDYLAAGRPVAINYGGWQETLLIEWGAGVRLSYTDLDGAAADLVRLVSDAAALRAASTAASELAHARFARDDLAAQLIAVLEQPGSAG